MIQICIGFYLHLEVLFYIRRWICKFITIINRINIIFIFLIKIKFSFYRLITFRKMVYTPFTDIQIQF